MNNKKGKMRENKGPRMTIIEGAGFLGVAAVVVSLTFPASMMAAWAAQIIGTNGNNVLQGTPFPDSIDALAGDDIVLAFEDIDVVCGDDGDDTINGGDEVGEGDKLWGGKGADNIYGGEGNDFLNGGYHVNPDPAVNPCYRVFTIGEGTFGEKLHGEGGNDEIIGTYGRETIEGGLGDDVVFDFGREEKSLIHGGDGNDKLHTDWGFITGEGGIDELWGGLKDDELRGGPGGDEIFALGGNDKIYGEGEDDKIFTAPGNDEVRAGAGNDVIEAGDEVDIIYGEGGIDRINAHGGNDKLDGGDGADHIFAGTGDDIILSSSAGDNIDCGDGHDIVLGGRVQVRNTTYKNCEFFPPTLQTLP